MSRQKRRAKAPVQAEERVLRVIEKPEHNVRWIVKERRHCGLERPEWSLGLASATERLLIVEPVSGTLPDILPDDAFPTAEQVRSMGSFGLLYFRESESDPRFLPEHLCFTPDGEPIFPVMKKRIAREQQKYGKIFRVAPYLRGTSRCWKTK